MIKTRAYEVSSFYPCLFSFCYSIVQVDEYQFSLAEVVLSGALPEGTMSWTVPWECNDMVQVRAAASTINLVEPVYFCKKY